MIQRVDEFSCWFLKVPEMSSPGGDCYQMLLMEIPKSQKIKIAHFYWLTSNLTLQLAAVGDLKFQLLK